MLLVRKLLLSVWQNKQYTTIVCSVQTFSGSPALLISLTISLYFPSLRNSSAFPS